MSTLQVRVAEPRDDAAIGELLVDSFVTAYAQKLPSIVTREERKRDLRDVASRRTQGTVLVAELEGQIVGTVTLYPPGAAKSEAWLPNAADLRQLAVSPAHFGKGHSAALMDEAERLAWSWGVDAVCLHVRRGVEGVARLYRRRGYLREPGGDLDFPHVFLEAYVLRRPKSTGE